MAGRRKRDRTTPTGVEGMAAAPPRLLSPVDSLAASFHRLADRIEARRGRDRARRDRILGRVR